MALSRRSFLVTGAALALAPRPARATPVVLRAGPVTAQILEDGAATAGMLGFNGTTPGPELRVRQGDRLEVRFENGAGVPSAIHWHGIRIENGMDGVPGLTQNVVEDGEGFDYSFVAPDAGTFWYHSHNRSWEQVALGLYGPLIVEEATPPAVDHDITVILDDWRIERTGEMMGGFGAMHDFAHAGRLGTYARALPSVSEVRRGDRLRLRLINTATARIFPLELRGVAGRIVAYDGFPLAAPAQIGPMMLAPAQRIDVIADVTDAVIFDFPTRDGPYELGRIAAEGENPAPIGGEIPALPPARAETPAETPDQALTLTMQGGAMGGAHEGDDIWAFNGVSGLRDTPWASFGLGQTGRITLVNETAFPHGIHLHGHHFHVVEDGALGPLRDTTLVMPDQQTEIVCVFDNPGRWLLHCHMLEHQAAGMKTWIEVA